MHRFVSNRRNPSTHRRKNPVYEADGEEKEKNEPVKCDTNSYWVPRVQFSEKEPRHSCSSLCSLLPRQQTATPVAVTGYIPENSISFKVPLLPAVPEQRHVCVLQKGKSLGCQPSRSQRGPCAVLISTCQSKERDYLTTSAPRLVSYLCARLVVPQLGCVQGWLCHSLSGP